MKREGNICKWYLKYEGACFCNGSLCCNPFSNEGCCIQNRDIFKTDKDRDGYEPSKEDEKLTKAEVWDVLEVKKGDVIGDWIIPYSNMDRYRIDPGIIIRDAKERVDAKFKDEDIKIVRSGVFHNVEVLTGEYGVYIVKVGRRM